MTDVRRCNKWAMVATGAVFGILSCTQSAIAATLSYTVTEVGNFPPLLNILSSATDINEAGQVIGTPLISRPRNSFLWENGEQQTIDPLTIPEPINLPTRFSSASAINNAGQVVGGSLYTNNIGNLSFQAFLWDEANGIQYLGALDFFEPSPGLILSDSFAYDINNQVQIVGSSLVSTPTELSTRAFLWENGVMQDLGIIGEARAINDLTQIAGTTTTDGFIPRRAFFWDNG
ncbi:MAG: hypothetical protein SVX43_06635, partial [Cyanobacteriota bacterium]|nr:hypothetical protein [Cyanobacteriota bacterium]